MRVACLQGQAAHPVKVFGRQVARVIHSVALKCLFAAVAPPRHEITIRAVLIGGPDQHFLVIAPQADEAVALIDLPPNQEVQDMLAVSPLSM